jgi:DNA invertase Pin-like site-specific DNA recombinase
MSRGALAVVAPPIPRAALYLRISEDRTGDEAGVQRQEFECRDLAARLGWEIIEPPFVDNDITASKRRVRRPAYEAMVAAVNRGEFEAILAWHPDRLYRQTRTLDDLIDLLDENAVLVQTVRSGVVDLTTASGRFTARSLANAAQYESELKGERVKAKHAESARKGLAHGGVRPFGYDRGASKGELVVNEAEATIIRECAERVLSGDSLRQIAFDMSRRAVPTVKGGPWSGTVVRDVLRSPRTAGLRPVAERVPGHRVRVESIGEGKWDPILDRATWEKVVAVLDHAPVGRRPRRHLLAGFLWCGRCGGRMFTSSKSNDRRVDGTRRGIRRLYTCRRDDRTRSCGAITISAPSVEEYITGVVLGRLRGADIGSVRPDVDDAVGVLIEADEAQLAELATAYGERRVSMTEWLTAKAPIEQRLKASRARLGRNRPNPLAGVADPGAAWDSLTFEQKRAAIGLVIDRVVVQPATKLGRFDNSRIEVTFHA